MVSPVFEYAPAGNNTGVRAPARIPESGGQGSYWLHEPPRRFK